LNILSYGRKELPHTQLLYTDLMIRHISGTVSHIGIDHIVVDVHGLGYLIFVPTPTAYTLDTTVKLHTYLAVRETALDLYGFTSLDELDIFILLLGIPKIGPKSAAQILNQTELEVLISAVVAEDPTQLTKLSGLGKKTAEKIVLGLKDAVAERGYDQTGMVGNTVTPGSVHGDAIDALVSLGYPQADARRAVQALPDTVTSVNEAVTAALKELSQS